MINQSNYYFDAGFTKIGYKIQSVAICDFNKNVG